MIFKKIEILFISTNFIMNMMQCTLLFTIINILDNKICLKLSISFSINILIMASNFFKNKIKHKYTINSK